MAGADLAADGSYISLVDLTPSPIDGYPSTAGWSEIMGTMVSPVCAGGPGTCDPVVATWSGAGFDPIRNRLLLFGGGHSDYGGNEIYSVDLGARTATRLTTPGQPPGAAGDTTPLGCTMSLAGGAQPNARHTYDGITFVPTANELFIFGGSLACSSGDFGSDGWVYDFAASKWARLPSNVGDYPKNSNAGQIAVFDPSSSKVVFFDLVNLYSFDPSTSQFTLYKNATNYAATQGYHKTGAIDAKRDRFVMIGDGAIYTADLTKGASTTLDTITTTGDSSIVDTDYAGIQYDSALDKIVAWNGGDKVYLLDLDTLAWTVKTVSGGPAATPNGMYKRFSYVPALDGFVVVTSVESNAYFLKLQ